MARNYPGTTGNYLSHADITTARFSLTQAWTVLEFIRVENTVSDERTLIGKWYNPSNQRQFLIRVASGTAPQPVQVYHAASQIIVGGNNINLNTWYLVAVTCQGNGNPPTSGATCNLYVLNMAGTVLDNVSGTTPVDDRSDLATNLEIGTYNAGGNDPMDGDIAHTAYVTAQLTLDEIRQYLRNPVSIVAKYNTQFYIPDFFGSPAVDYSGNGRNFTVNGTTALGEMPPTSPIFGSAPDDVPVAVAAGATLVADAGSLAITGTDAGLQQGRTLAANPGSLSVTGTDAGLISTSIVIADAGSLAITGSDAALNQGRLVSAEAGTFAVTGTAADLQYGRVLTAEAGSLAVTGSDATLNYSGAAKTLTAEAGSYVLTGSAVTFILTIDADAGAYAVTGTAAGLRAGFTLTAESGTYALTGSDAALSKSGNPVIAAEAGAYALTGATAGVLAARNVAADAAAYAITGTDATLLTGLGIAANAGSYLITGASADLLAVHLLTAEAAAYTLTGADATLTAAGEDFIDLTTFTLGRPSLTNVLIAT